MKLTIKDNIYVSVNKETGTPRFKLESPEIELDIAIDDITKLNIITPSTVKWEDHLPLKYMVFDWLYQKHHTYNILNKDVIKNLWEIENPSLKI